MKKFISIIVSILFALSVSGLAFAATATEKQTAVEKKDAAKLTATDKKASAKTKAAAKKAAAKQKAADEAK